MICIKRYFLAIAALFCGLAANGQPEGFCDAVNAILRDAPNQFRNVHGGMKESNATASVFKSNIKVPGTLNSRFVSSMGLFYEGALFQSSDKEVITRGYDEYKEGLRHCLEAQGYHMTSVDNWVPQTHDFRKLIFTKNLPADADVKTMPGHVTMEVDYDKTRDLYTLSFYIFDH